MRRSGVNQLIRAGGVVLATVVLLYAAALIALRLMGFSLSVVMSDSMKPAAVRGDVVISRATRQYAKGDVVLFQRGEVQVLHRLVEQAPAGWTTRGDANQGNDPWLLSQSALQGKAVGVLRGFGLPLLWLAGRDEAIASHAQFTTGSAGSGAVVAKHWQTPAMTWTIYANAASITATATTLDMVGSGERRAWAGTRYATDSRVHLEGYLVAADATKPGLSVLLNACVNSSDALSCGWVVFFDNLNKRVALYTQVTNLTRSALITSCAFPSGVSVTSPQVLVVQHIGKRIYVTVNGVSCLRVEDAPAAASQVGAKLPTGNFSGVALSATNTLKSTKISIN